MNRNELQDVGLSAVALGAGFAILFFGDGRPGFVLSAGFVPAAVVTTLIAAVSFLPHVMGHRVSARAIKAYAEYSMWTPGAVITVLSGFLGVVAAVPGGIEMYRKRGERYGHWDPELTVKQIGLVAVLGPLMNVLIAVIFAFLASSATVTMQGMNLLLVGSQMNAFIAIFTMIPFYPLDGYKVLRWHTPLWLAVLGLSGLLFFL